MWRTMHVTRLVHSYNGKIYAPVYLEAYEITGTIYLYVYM